MKFTEQLALGTIPELAPFYLDYKGIKLQVELASQEIDIAKRSALVDNCIELLRAELQKVNTKFIDEEKECRSTLNQLRQRHGSLQTPHQRRMSLPHEPVEVSIKTAIDEGEDWRSELQGLLHRLESLVEFAQSNVIGCRKIIKKLDKQCRVEKTQELWAIVTALPFASSEQDEAMLTEARHMWRNGAAISSPSRSESPEIQAANNNVAATLSLSAGLGIGELLKPIVPTKAATTLTLPRLTNRLRRVSIDGTSISEYNAETVVNIRTVDELNVADYPVGMISRVWVDLAENGMGQSIKVPVIIARGHVGGPVVGLTAALHGNELNGIPLIHRLFTEIHPSTLHGTVVAVPIANVPGYNLGQRGFSDGTDLNRVMPGKLHGSSPQAYAYQLMNKLICKFEYLLDLHTASRGRANSLYVRANMLDDPIRRMAKLQNPQIIVHNSSPDGSLRGAAMDLGIPSITVEIGDPSRFQKRFVKNALLGVTNILAHLRMIPEDHFHVAETEPVICARSFWIFTDRGGILNVVPDINTWVKKGDPIAYLSSVFGTLEQTYLAPEDGIVIGKSIDPVCQTGSRILHLGIVGEKFPDHADDGHM
ncbi:hypothetical protein GQ42DRAFT_164429 [Ramicandelaber brevisporus]|nr:hypothetical protein GQ42DRAFT_165478 [Ramicandelaber brevisporus]KAI8868023.1 hypothetical protein GQ42DRAFT_164429 [Ramicandelaber brevisporus]